jgi:hypothetical protein
MPAVRSETSGTGSQTWLGSTHGIYNCRSGNIDISAFTANTHYPNGYLPSGLPLAKLTSTDKWVPYNSGGTGGAQTLAGFLYTDQRVSGSGEDFNAPVFQHGFVNVDHLPIALTVPTGVSQFVFVGAGV